MSVLVFSPMLSAGSTRFAVRSFDKIAPPKFRQDGTEVLMPKDSHVAVVADIMNLELIEAAVDHIHASPGNNDQM